MDKRTIITNFAENMEDMELKKRCVLLEEREALLINRRKILYKIAALKSLFESTGKILIEIDSEIEKLNNKKI